MMNAYDELYLGRAQIALGAMLDYAVNDLHFKLEKFYHLFLAVGLAGKFERGDASCIAGCSGAELALNTLRLAGLETDPILPGFREGRSKEFWTGWALAYYQWSEAEAFRRIEEYMPVKKILEMYDPYHEMDIRQFADAVRIKKNTFEKNTALARLRKYAEMSQNMLAAQSDVPVRTIQQYEQRRKHIEKAGMDQLSRLGRALGCRVEDLVTAGM